MSVLIRSSLEISMHSETPCFFVPSIPLSRRVKNCHRGHSQCLGKSYLRIYLYLHISDKILLLFISFLLIDARFASSRYCNFSQRDQLPAHGFSGLPLWRSSLMLTENNTFIQERFNINFVWRSYKLHSCTSTKFYTIHTFVLESTN